MDLTFVVCLYLLSFLGYWFALWKENQSWRNICVFILAAVPGFLIYGIMHYYGQALDAVFLGLFAFTLIYLPLILIDVVLVNLLSLIRSPPAWAPKWAVKSKK
jgi:hypothetical protein